MRHCRPAWRCWCSSRLRFSRCTDYDGVGSCAGSGSSAAAAAAQPARIQRRGSGHSIVHLPAPFQPPVLIRNATIIDGGGTGDSGGSILFKDGRIVSVGTSVQAPSDAVVVDGTGKWVTPGVIDTHSHIGVYAAPGTFAESDATKATRPVTPGVGEHSFCRRNPQIPLAIAGGVTTIQALPVRRTLSVGAARC